VVGCRSQRLGRVELGGGGLEDWFRISGSGVITDSNTAVVTDEHVPGLDSKTEERIRVGCPVVLPEEVIEGIGIDELIERWEVDWVNPGGFCQRFDEDFCWRLVPLGPVFGIHDWLAAPIHV
jgi:hypothetical protein